MYLSYTIDFADQKPGFYMMETFVVNRLNIIAQIFQVKKSCLENW